LAGRAIQAKGKGLTSEEFLWRLMLLLGWQFRNTWLTLIDVARSVMVAQADLERGASGAVQLERAREPGCRCASVQALWCYVMLCTKIKNYHKGLRVQASRQPHGMDKRGEGKKETGGEREAWALAWASAVGRCECVMNSSGTQVQGGGSS
jgi:hypothetical protein